jgi:hypothetical protein
LGMALKISTRKYQEKKPKKEKKQVWISIGVMLAIMRVLYSRRQKYRNAERTLWEKVIFSALWKIGFSSEGDEFWFTVSHVG